MSISATRTGRKVIRHLVRCGVPGCGTVIGRHVWKEGLKKYDDGYVFEPNASHAGGKQVVCKDHAGKAR